MTLKQVQLCLCVGRRRRSAVMVIVVTLSMCRVAAAQVRGVYPTRMSAINAGVTPTSGLTYSNLFIFNARDESKDTTGEVVETGSNTVMIDLNTFVWVTQGTLLGGARFSAAALVVAGQNFSDARVVVMITVVMIVSFAVLMPLARVLARRQQPSDIRAGAAAAGA